MNRLQRLEQVAASRRHFQNQYDENLVAAAKVFSAGGALCIGAYSAAPTVFSLMILKGGVLAVLAAGLFAMLRFFSMHLGLSYSDKYGQWLLQIGREDNADPPTHIQKIMGRADRFHYAAMASWLVAMVLSVGTNSIMAVQALSIP